MLFLTPIFLALLGCQLKPTKVKEVREYNYQELVKAAREPIALTQETVILDVRPRFEYELSHVPGSVSFSWDALSETSGHGEVMSDLRRAGQRLALLGISPNTPVVIVGRGVARSGEGGSRASGHGGGGPSTSGHGGGPGTAGQGEEGRLAWTLVYLGVRNVQVVSVSYFGQAITTQPTEPRANVDQWIPKPNEALVATREEVLRFVTHQPQAASATDATSASPSTDTINADTATNSTDTINADTVTNSTDTINTATAANTTTAANTATAANTTNSTRASNRSGATAGLQILDVRSEREYFAKSGVNQDYQTPNMGAINIDWREFYTEEGRVNPEIRPRLQSIGVDLNKRLIIVSNNGLRSGAAAFALMSMGYRNVANYTAGLNELLLAPSPSSPGKMKSPSARKANKTKPSAKHGNKTKRSKSRK